MDSSGQEGEEKKKVIEVRTFPVPFPLIENQENFTINTNTPSKPFESPKPSKPSKEQIINQAIQFHLKGNIPEATKYYQLFINQGFTDHMVFCNYGLILKQLGKSQEAERLTRKAIELSPDFANAHSNLGIILKDLGNLKEAELSYRKAIEIKPDYAEAHSNLGVLLKDLGKLKEAEVSTRKAIELKPSRLSYFNYSSCLFENRSFDAAKINLSKAYSSTGSNPTDSFLSAAKSRINYAKKQSTDQSKSDQLGSSKRSDRIILNRIVESELIDYLYTLNNIKIEFVKREFAKDARYGKGLCSDFNLFEDKSPIIKKLEADLKEISKKALEIKEIIFEDSFFNIFTSGSGAIPHNHIGPQDENFGIKLHKYSLVYYLERGDQSGQDPGILKLYNPDKNILPVNGMIVIIDAKQLHSVSYSGTKDRVMVGVNFYGL